MREQNGVRIFEAGEKAPAPKGLRTDFEVSSPFGFKIIEIDGRLMWAAASEGDYRKTIAQLHGISPDQVTVETRADPCRNASPTTCTGICWAQGVFCTLIYQPFTQHYVCVCTTSPRDSRGLRRDE